MNSRRSGRISVGRFAVIFVLVSCMTFAIFATACGAANQRGQAPAAAPQPKVPSASDKMRVATLFGRLPMRFERNDGQTDARVKFLARGEGYTLFLTPEEAVLALQRTAEPHAALADARRTLPSGEGRGRKLASPEERGISGEAKGAVKTQVLRVKLVGANPNARIEGADQLAAGSNYFIGNDPKKWHTDVPNYSKVELEGVYPGIDLIYRGGEQGQLEYDFRLAPGTDPKAIRLSFKGQRRLSLDHDGDLVVGIGEGKLIEHVPEIYQEIGGRRRAVEGGWLLRGAHEAGFKVARYDRTKRIVIDPKLLYSTYLGGNNYDPGYGIAVDSAGFAYVTGYTDSTDFPTLNAFQSTLGGPYAANAFVAKLNPSVSGSASLLYSTYLGGSGDFGAGEGIAVDSSGNAYVTGWTESTNFPTLNAYQSSCPPASNLEVGCFAAFVAKLNPSASGTASLLYSTYLGGSGNGYLGTGDQGQGIVVDSSGNAYVTGYTGSTNFPTLNAFQSSCPSASGPIGCAAAFVAKLNPSASGSASLLYSTYLGGSGNANRDIGDQGLGIAVDSSGNAYVTGQATSTDFPTLNAFESSCPSALILADGCRAAFVAKLNPALSGAASLLYSTYLDGNYGDSASGIAVDSAGFAYVAGETYAVNNLSCTASGTPAPCCTGTGTGTCLGFPTLNAFQSANNGIENAFVAKLNPSASGAASLVYSTYLGGNFADSGDGIAVDSAGFAYVTGFTESLDFPTVNAFQSSCPSAGGSDGCNAAFVAKLNPSASGAASLVYSTYLGGDFYDSGSGITVDSSGNAYVTGFTESTNFPTLNAFQSTNNGGSNAFVAKFSPAIPSKPGKLTISPPALSFGDKTKVGKTSRAKSVTIKNDSSKKSKLDVSITGEATGAPFTVKKSCTTTLDPERVARFR